MGEQLPEYTKFPPFYTVQPIDRTREYQMELWGQVVTQFCERRSISVVTLADFLSLGIFKNEEINRKLSEDGIKLVFDYMQRKKQIQQLGQSSKYFVAFKSIVDWANDLLDYGTTYGLSGSSTTFFSLQNEDTSVFYKCDTTLLLAVCEVLKSKGKIKLAEKNGSYGILWK
ncbi:vacuolar protein-sorting-associated protein, putative [Entamoeba invadens IP1]|uniref:vacuolar protein-sorting-associated protein, putative n=1 Tax=Entamoeba invadens IP1 TaxID=370355 RepID=UPI0002C3D9DF|nr:vacuolar protein-sorting-associated protein, putative [Entamoeba invadens IP1]ELP85389.1 vacuolar protein-sorting-associated protein, putative [Entamoeba invadens IP1]|eukprot:XP_004184735.1 vacuolar protein-sorting-associated protein, putative [Entamoeba invadens IP1]